MSSRVVQFQGGPHHNRLMQLESTHEAQILFPLAPDIRFIEEDDTPLPNLKCARYIRSGMKTQTKDGVVEVWIFDGVVD